MNPMADKIMTLWPEVTMLIGAFGCLFMGLSSSVSARKSTSWLAMATLVITGIFVWLGETTDLATARDASFLSRIPVFIKLTVVGLGVLLLLVSSGVPEQLKQEVKSLKSKRFEPGDTLRGEFFAFFLLSLTGVMLCAGARDLVWLFLSLELTSLPTYVMVAVTRDHAKAREAAVKYFFLGALAAAVFLYGFALIYGATGLTEFSEIREMIHQQEAVPPLFVLGLVLAVIGVSFKIAAVPMHFYVADVYQGATSAVTSFLAIVPKLAGFVSLISLLGLTRFMAGQSFQPMIWLLWIMAASTMTIGNVLGLFQTNIKRMMAYSSVAHSGYMLVGLLAVSSASSDQAGAASRQALGDGVAAVFFYLIAYGLATLGVFAVLGCVWKQSQEAETLDDIAGLGRRQPVAGVIMLVSVLSLLGLPPLVGFVGKIYLFGSAIEHGYLALVVIAVLNSAVSAAYYLRIISACYFAAQNEQTRFVPDTARWFGGATAAAMAVLLGLFGHALAQAAHHASPATDAPQAKVILSQLDQR